MGEFTEIILTGGVVLLGAWAVKKYFDTWQPETWQPLNRTCIGPICWSSYGPGGTASNPPISQLPSQTPGGSLTQIDPLSLICFPGTELFLPPCALWRAAQAANVV